MGNVLTNIFEILIYPGFLPEVKIIVLMSVVVAAFWANANRELVFRKRTYWLLLPIVIPVIIGAYGILFEYQGPRPAPPWRGAVVWYLIALHLLMSVFLMWKLRDIVLVAAAVSLLQILVSLSVGFFVGMAVTNDWL